MARLRSCIIDKKTRNEAGLLVVPHTRKHTMSTCPNTSDVNFDDLDTWSWYLTTSSTLKLYVDKWLVFCGDSLFFKLHLPALASVNNSQLYHLHLMAVKWRFSISKVQWTSTVINSFLFLCHVLIYLLMHINIH